MTGVLHPPVADRGAAGPTLAAAALGFFVLTLDTQVVTVAVPVIGAELHAGIPAMQWVVSGYTLLLAALLLTAGSLADRVGARAAFGFGLGAFTVASAACGLAPGIEALVAARLVQGAAAAVVLPASLGLVRQAFPAPAARARAVAAWTAAGGAAMAAGPLIGGVLAGTFGWRWVFLVNLPVGAVALLALIRAPRSVGRPRPFDLPGQLTATVAVAALTYAVIQQNAVALLVCALAGAAFVVVERRAAHPVVPLGLVRSAAVAAPTAVGFALNFAFYGAVFLLALYLEHVQQLSPLTAGLMFLPMTALITVVNLVAGPLTTRFGPRLPVLVGQAVLLVGVLGLLVLHADSPLVVQAAVLVPFGLGAGLAVPALTATLLDAVPADRTGLAGGILNSGRQLGGVLGTAVFGALAGESVLTGLHRGALLAGLALVVTMTLTTLTLAGRPVRASR
jgi:DHA2 family methylenomycin A resistance protein-like MFS transporter